MGATPPQRWPAIPARAASPPAPPGTEGRRESGRLASERDRLPYVSELDPLDLDRAAIVAAALGISRPQPPAAEIDHGVEISM
jgi:hypothetical protein